MEMIKRNLEVETLSKPSIELEIVLSKPYFEIKDNI